MQPLDVVSEMKIVGQSPSRFGWLVKPIRWLLFPLIRPYLQYLVEHIGDASLLPSEMISNDGIPKRIRERVKNLSTTQQELSNRLEVSEKQWRSYIKHFDEKDYVATVKRLAAIEDSLAEINNKIAGFNSTEKI